MGFPKLLGQLGENGNKNPKLGLIFGSNKVAFDGLAEFDGLQVKTEFGTAELQKNDSIDAVLLLRHGSKANIPPHMINHRANLMGFKKSNVEKILSFTSVGTLKPEFKPGTMIIPDDYINMGNILTFYDNEIRHVVPGFDHGLRKMVYSEIKELPLSIRFDGVYIQTQGPRLETRAEIQMMKNYGDVVGMTMAAEATLAKELGLGYANISIIDNYCNGITGEALSLAELEENQIKNSENLKLIIRKLIT